MGILSNNIYDFPYWCTHADYHNPPSTDEEVLEYITEVKNFFKNTLGFFGKIDTYNQKQVCYFSEEENGDPCFCFCEYFGTASGYPKKLYSISPCTYNEEEEYYIPMQGALKPGSTVICAVGICSNLISIGFDQRQNVCKPIIQDIKFTDGRRLLLLKNKNITTNDDQYLGINGALYFTKIYFQENIELNKWIIFANTPSTSYFQEIGKTACFSNGQSFHGDYDTSNKQAYSFICPNILEASGGFLPDPLMLKDFLLKIPQFYIGDEAYLKEISFFSKIKDLNNLGSLGTIISIKNKNFIILKHRIGARSDSIINSNYQSIFTISWIIPVDIEENEEENNNAIFDNEEPNISIVNSNQTHYHQNLEEETPSFTSEEE